MPPLRPSTITRISKEPLHLVHANGKTGSADGPWCREGDSASIIKPIERQRLLHFTLQLFRFQTLAYSDDIRYSFVPKAQMFFTSVFAFAALSYFIYSLYQRLLPRPIPGIPYNVDATSSLFGEIPRFQQETKSSNLFKWLIRQSRVHQTPIFQAFIEPLRKPTVVLVDFREGQDVLMRRKEFDRSDFTIDTLSGEAPTFHINLKTGPEWKAHRRLLQDLMSPKFLHEVAAPNIYKSSTQLLKLWKKKTQITGGKPFEAEMDIFYAALDAVVDFGFGDSVEQRALSCQIEAMDGYESKCQKAAEGTFFDFPIAPIDQYLQAMLNSADNVGPVSASGWPKLAWWLISWKPSVQRNRAIIDEFTRDQLIKAAKRYTNGKANDSDDFVKSAIDLMVQREGTAANKEGREPVFWNRTMRDEVSGKPCSNYSLKG